MCFYFQKSFTKKNLIIFYRKMCFISQASPLPTSVSRRGENISKSAAEITETSGIRNLRADAVCFDLHMKQLCFLWAPICPLKVIKFSTSPAATAEPRHHFHLYTSNDGLFIFHLQSSSWVSLSARSRRNFSDIQLIKLCFRQWFLHWQTFHPRHNFPQLFFVYALNMPFDY